MRAAPCDVGASDGGHLTRRDRSCGIGAHWFTRSTRVVDEQQIWRAREGRWRVDDEGVRLQIARETL
jgi:hypothetical protein